MKRITQCFTVLAMLCIALTVQAQNESTENQIDSLRVQKERIVKEEKTALKEEVQAINEKLDKKEITQEQADLLKQEVATKRALNIENRTAIIDNKIALLRRNEDTYFDEYTIFGVTVKTEDDDFVGIRFGDRNNDPIRYDKRTSSDLVISFGWNNVAVDGGGLNASPYKFWGSRYFELGWAWKTRLLNNSNALRLKYGMSFQWNGLKLTDNRYFVQNGDETTFEVHPYDLKKAKLNVTNFILPVHLEFGPSRKTQTDSYVRYSSRNQFKMGLGAYMGFNVGTYQKLKYTDDTGDKGKDKIKKDYNVTDFVYGLSGYMAISNVGVYVRYELSPLFEDQAVDQHNVSLGFRFDMN